jgi:hypothetical protein
MCEEWNNIRRKNLHLCTEPKHQKMKAQNITIDPNWINKNKNIVAKYAGKWIAINPEKGIIAFSHSRKELSEKCEALNIPCIFYHVPPYSGIVRFLPIYFKSI